MKATNSLQIVISITHLICFFGSHRGYALTLHCQNPYLYEPEIRIEKYFLFFVVALLIPDPTNRQNEVF